MENVEFSLTCHVEVHGSLPYHAKFTKNDVEIETNDYVTITELQHEKDNRQRSFFNLTVLKGLKSRDAGDYKCTIIDYYKNTNSAFATV